MKPQPGGNGNQIHTLLDGTSTAVIPHMMSVALTFPPALHSLDTIPAFDVEQAELSTVTTDQLGPAQGPPIGDADPAWPPAPASSPPQDLWTQVPATWTSPSLKDAGRTAAITDFASVLGWKASDGKSAWTMQKGWNTYPKKLVSAFKQNAFACPGMAKGLAAVAAAK